MSSVYCSLSISLIICDALAIFISNLLSPSIFLLLSGLKTIISLLLFFFFFILLCHPNVDYIKLHKVVFITSSLLFVVHILVIIISCIFSVPSIFYALSLHPLLLLLSWLYLQRPQKGPDNSLLAHVDEALLPKRYDIKELNAATNNFNLSVSTCRIYSVFNGMLSNGKKIMILRYNNSQKNASSFAKEISASFHSKHENIWNLLGYCLTPHFVYFVYNYPNNCILFVWIFNEDASRRKALTVSHRYQVALDVARALDYLNNHCKNFLLDSNPTNIVLHDHFKAKVVTFGLWRVLGGGGSLHDYMSSKLLENSNVYSFGMLLLELVSGQMHWRSFNDGEIFNILYCKLKEGKMFELVDQSLEINWIDKESLKILLHITLLCVQEKLENRPSIEQIVAMLIGRHHSLYMKEFPSVHTRNNSDNMFGTAKSIILPFDDYVVHFQSE